MMHLSLAAKESIKTGLAMALACGCAMALGWSNPAWACIAVAVVSLPTVGETLQKCVQRLWGTGVGGAVALMCLALFPQERWACLACLAGYVGLCAYRITTSRAVYFWFLSGYVCLLIAAAIIGTSAQHAFDTAVLRVQETALGILAYALVSVFLWPQRSAPGLASTVMNLLGAQAKIAHLSLGLTLGEAPDEAPGKWLGLGDQLLGQLRRRLDAAVLEQLTVRARQGWWLRAVDALQAMQSALLLWQEALPELRHMDATVALPHLPELHEALRARFLGLQAILDGKAQGEEPARPWPADEPRLASLSHLQRASVSTLVAALGRVDAASRDLAQALAALGESRSRRAPAPAASRTQGGGQADGDSYAALIRGMAAVWVASGIWIAIDPPGHMAFVVFVGLFTLMGVMVPLMDWGKFLLVNMVGVVIAAILYVCVMPGLSRPWEFLALLAALTAGISYVSWHPRLTALKLAGIVPFIMMTNIQNRQTYDFALFVNNAAAMAFGIVVAAGLAHMPFSTRPERMFDRVLRRFFRQAQLFLAACRDAPAGSRESRRCGRTLASLRRSAGKLGGWAGAVEARDHGPDAKARAAALVASLNSIVHGFQLLAEVRAQAPDGRQALARDFRSWHETLLEAVRHWGHAPRAAASETTILAGLRDAGEAMGHRIESAFEAASAEMPPGDLARAYRLLGGYRGAHRALLDHAALSAAFNWSRWQENRF